MMPMLLEAAARGEIIGEVCRWKKRKRDSVVVIGQLFVDPERRRSGRAREMVREVIARNPGCDVLAKCPVDREDYAAGQAFWAAMGFVHERTEKGMREWWLRPSSATARMEIPPTPGSQLPPASATV